MSKTTGVLMIALALFSSIPFSGAETKERSDIQIQDTWNLADIYLTDAAWRTAKDQLASRIDEFTRFQGKLSSPAEILACLDLSYELTKEYNRLSSYASMKSDQDTRETQAMGMKQEVSQLGTDFNSRASFIEPELVKLDPATLESFIVQEPKLSVYRMYLFDIQRRKAHKLSEKEEKIVAEAGLMADGPYSINTIFSNADLPYPEVKLSDGAAVKLNPAGYSRYRAVPNRADRELVFHEFWTAMKKFERTFGSQLSANVKKDMFYARVRNYPSSLVSALDANAIPETVYRALIDNVNENLASFHRYLKLKQRMLGVDTLKYSDLYAPVVKGVELNYTIDEAKKLVQDAVKPLGKSYLTTVDKAFKNRWVDVYPTTGKLSGAYSNGSVFDVHPYILLNYNGQYDDVSTLAHELGHTMHSYLSNTTQPYPLADYSIFVAEVASTFNEALLIHKMLNEIKDDDTRLSLLMEYLDGIKGTVFRQTQFAEYELAIHEKAEKGEALTGEAFTQLYGDILKKYYGADKGVCQIDDLVTVEWAYIPHFYYNFYVYQYATSFTASTALAEKVINGEKGAADNYLKFLSSGGSKYPIDLLKVSGVDMTTKDPFQLTMKAMNRTMDEIEKILDKKAGKK